MDAEGTGGDRVVDVAVTGPTGTFGEALVPLLLGDERIRRVVGIARRPVDPSARGWDGLEYRQGDVRDREGLEEAFAGADVVVHLAFLITGAASPSTIRSINVDGTLNAFRAAVSVGARRFVYASSVAAYGFHSDNPETMTEDWPVRPAAHLFYAREKAELEQMLRREAEMHPTELYLLRPPIVLGPHAVGAKSMLPEPLMAALGHVASAIRRSPVPVPVPAPPLPVQFIHEHDVATAFLQCIVGAGPPGAYNITGDGVITLQEIAREVGLLPIGVPAGPSRLAARMVSALPVPPFLPPVTEWAEALAHPPIMDAARARSELGWAPRYSSLEALRATINPTDERTD
jgi:nucleoside-diphosphate-sugar epimerase